MLLYAKKCKVVCFDETQHGLADRFTEHLRSIRLQYKNSHGFPVPERFNQIDHSIDEISVSGCKMTHYCKAAQYCHIEHRLPFKIGSLKPNG